MFFASTTSVYGSQKEVVDENCPEAELRPQSPYAVDKVHGENLCRAFFKVYDLECVALRYFNIFGPRQRPDSDYAAVVPLFIDALLLGRSPVVYGDGLQSRDFTFVKNAVQANLRAAEAAGASGGVFNVGNGKQTNILELLEILSRIIGADLEPTFEKARLGDVRDSLADLSLSCNVLGYEPAVDLEQGLQETVAWFRERGETKS